MDRIKDSALATTLITSPAWAVALEQINILLSTITLSIGLVVGIHRLIRIAQGMKVESDD